MKHEKRKKGMMIHIKVAADTGCAWGETRHEEPPTSSEYHGARKLSPFSGVEGVRVMEPRQVAAASPSIEEAQKEELSL